jgi:hypothetical protein
VIRSESKLFRTLKEKEELMQVVGGEGREKRERRQRRGERRRRGKGKRRRSPDGSLGTSKTKFSHFIFLLRPAVP